MGEIGRTASHQRQTAETSILVNLAVDGEGRSTINTGLPFFDHMLAQVARHGSMDLEVKATGDLDVDSHHTVEDVALVLGKVFAEALGDKVGITRFASGLFPLDEALVEVALDISGRPFAVISLDMLGRQQLGTPPFNPELVNHFFQSFSTEARVTLHVTQRAGGNTHHVIEAAFKGFGRSLWVASRRINDMLPSTKESL